jgi:very-short-patch-repair endonuclease
MNRHCVVQHSTTRSELEFRPHLEALCLERGWTMGRHYSIGPYYLDFAIIEQKVCIEIDGSAHKYAKCMAKDIRRNSFSARSAHFRPTPGARNR